LLVAARLAGRERRLAVCPDIGDTDHVAVDEGAGADPRALPNRIRGARLARCRPAGRQ
jgi:hypothetical protein